MICGHTTHNQKRNKSFHCITLKPDLFWLSKIRSQSWFWVGWPRDHDVRIKNAYKNKLTHEKYLTYRFWCRPIPGGLSFLIIHLDTLCSYNIMQKHNFLHVKSTFLNISIQFITTQHLKWCGSTHKHQKGPITYFKWANDLVLDKVIERGNECIGFDGLDQVRFEGSIGA